MYLVHDCATFWLTWLLRGRQNGCTSKKPIDGANHPGGQQHSSEQILTSNWPPRTNNGGRGIRIEGSQWCLSQSTCGISLVYMNKTISIEMCVWYFCSCASEKQYCKGHPMRTLQRTGSKFVIKTQLTNVFRIIWSNMYILYNKTNNILGELTNRSAVIKSLLAEGNGSFQMLQPSCYPPS